MIPLRAFIVATLAVTAAVTVAACTGPSNVDTAASSTRAPLSTRDAAPRTRDPLNAARLIADPCSALSVSQLADVALTDVHRDPILSAGEPLCTWSDNATSSSVGVTWMTASTLGLSLDYTEKSDFAYFIPTTIDGYPAVFDSFADLRSQGQCSVSVGISDSLFFVAKYDSESAATTSWACQYAAHTATDIVKNLGGP